ncbi:MAG: N-acetylneuraminate synthase [Bdellovibrionales bacterium]|nr:N-acetylneuraminate synthase [Bdellovibrionales bacterium]
MNKTTVIAEAGVNHNGSLDLAYQLVDAASAAGADYVKFQTFVAERLVTRMAQKASYQTRNTDSSGSQFEMLRSLELKPKFHRILADYSKKNNIQFLSTPFDIDSARFLVDEVGIETIKIPSGELTNAPFLLDIARLKKPMILSTGMATIGEIETALSIIAFGLVAPAANEPNLESFRAAFRSVEGQRFLSDYVSLLHCTTEYPAPLHEVNLYAMKTMRRTFQLPVGYSDHTPGIAVSIAAVALGARIIEKHFTLDKTLPGPDHKASLETSELNELILGIRAVEQSLGSYVKIPRPSEIPNIPIARKSLVAARSISTGELFSRENLTTKRPGSGVSAIHFWDWIGQKASQNFNEDDLIK